jgi:hypothetical protein
MENVGFYQLYENIKWMLARSPEATKVAESTPLYVADLNLDEELKSLGSGDVVFDVGCAYGAGTEGLKRRYPQLHFVGVEPIRPLPTDADKVSVPIVRGGVEDLSSSVRSQLEPSLYPPSVILFRNVMQFLYAAETYGNLPGLIRIGLREIQQVLAEGGKALVYDQDFGPDSYAEYIKQVRENKIVLTCNVLENTNSSKYLSLLKVSP